MLDAAAYSIRNMIRFLNDTSRKPEFERALLPSIGSCYPTIEDVLKLVIEHRVAMILGKITIRFPEDGHNFYHALDHARVEIITLPRALDQISSVKPGPEV